MAMIGIRIITSEHASYDSPNSEEEVAGWTMGDSSRPRMIPGQTRATSYPYPLLHDAAG